MPSNKSYQAVPQTEDTFSSPAGAPPPPAYGAAPLHPQPRSDDVASDDFKMGLVSQVDIVIRMAFVRKVYSILFAQLALTSSVGAFFMFCKPVQAWIHQNQWMMFLSLFGTIGMMLALFWKRHSYPANFYLLGGFTLLEAYAVGNIVTYYDTIIVLEATIITAGLFLGLTLFTMQSKWDFSGMGPYLFTGLWMLIISGFVGMFFPHNGVFEIVYAVVGALIFSAYIIYDTYLIMNKLSVEEYIVAAISLYLDIINLFLNILRILNSQNDN
ncbi:hypothetical protein YB2330_004071 [Saitoella coloradoensis]